MGWNYPNPIYMYPKRKRRPQCSKCRFELEGKCYQRKYSEYDYAELEGKTNQNCGHFEEGNKEDKDKLVKKINRQIETSAQTGCCIIVCILGTGYNTELKLIRRWRDDFLKENWIGEKFVNFYYRRFSPLIIKLIGDKLFLKQIVKFNILMFSRILKKHYKTSD